jgi:hypothetical protein
MSTTEDFDGRRGPVRSFDRQRSEYLIERSNGFKDLVQRRSQIAERFHYSTLIPDQNLSDTDPVSNRLHELAVARGSGADSAFAKAAASQRPPTRDPVKGMRITERWEGRVLEVEDGFFTAELKPLGKSEPVIVGDVSNGRVDEEDRQLITDNAAFYLLFGHIPITATSQIPVQLIRFSRVGIWRTAELEQLRERGQALFRAIEVDDSE